MASTGTIQAKVGLEPAIATAISDAGSTTRVEPKRVGYGLPCSNCGTYYAADKALCPICKCSERVSPVLAKSPAVVPSAERQPNDGELEVEREKFLREFRAHIFSDPLPVHEPTSFGCTLDHNHDGEYEGATVCNTCYARALERADQLEAALHMDLKEATQIIYEAVWADPSDPSKTYQNAAQAILTALRQRAGVDGVLSTLQPYAH